MSYLPMPTFSWRRIACQTRRMTATESRADDAISDGMPHDPDSEKADEGAAADRIWPRPLPPRFMLPLAAVSGILTYTAFPPLGWWPLAPMGVTGLAVAASGQRLRAAAVAGLVFSLFFFGMLVWWLHGNIGWGAWAALTVSESVLLALMCLPLPLLLRLPTRPVVLAVWWTATEAVRSRVPLGGFPWGRLAFSQQGSPVAGWARLSGAPSVTFITALVAGALLAAALVRSRRELAAAGAWIVAAGLLAISVPVPSAHWPGPTANIALVQGNVARTRSLSEQTRVIDVASRHLTATEHLAQQIASGQVPRPDVVLWPENAMDADPRDDPQLTAIADQAAAAVDRPVLLGAILDGPGGRTYNAGLLWSPTTGPGAWYAKRQLVPFGEYIPARSLLGGLGKLQLIPRDFSPGHTTGVLNVGGIHLGDVICYEIGYDKLVRSDVHGGANLLVEQTNDSTFIRDGSTGETEQQLAMARLRAVEHDRAVAVVSTTGISAVIMPDGTLVQHTTIWTQDVLSATVPLRTDVTLADRVGAWPEAIIGLAASALVGWVAWRGRRGTDT